MIMVSLSSGVSFPRDFSGQHQRVIENLRIFVFAWLSIAFDRLRLLRTSGNHASGMKCVVEDVKLSLVPGGGST